MKFGMDELGETMKFSCAGALGNSEMSATFPAMPSALRRLLLILIVFSPALFMARLVYEKSVDVGRGNDR